MKKQKKNKNILHGCFKTILFISSLLIVILQTKTCRHNFWDLISGWVLLQQ